jgi:fimbrial chaperone protein
MIKAVILTLVLSFTLLAFPVAARADLTITPVRVVFQGRDRSMSVELLNITDHTNTYRMGWLEMKADDKGGYSLLPADDKNPNSVSNMVVFSPRQVTIEPHGHQVIRLSLRRPADLPPGEYRAHLSMTRIANALPPVADPHQKGVTMALYANLGFSIPVIVRSGEDKGLKVSLINPQLAMSHNTPPAPVLHIDLNRDGGKFSTYGSIKVLWQPAKGEEQQIGLLNNVALYPEVQQRHVEVTLNQNPTSGTLKVVYLGKLESEGTTWAETSFPIGK